MKRLSVLLLVAALALTLLSAVPAHAKEPLRATTTHEQPIGPVMDFPYLLGWVGGIHDDIDGCIEWWIDVRTWTAWPYILAELPPPNATHYTEKVEIYNTPWVPGQQQCVGGEADLLLRTLGQGTTTMANTTWRANGVVVKANGAFSHWLGRRVHESGQFDVTTTPWAGTSLFRIN
jgi:hypothetical protein